MAAPTPTPDTEKCPEARIIAFRPRRAGATPRGNLRSVVPPRPVTVIAEWARPPVIPEQLSLFIEHPVT